MLALVSTGKNNLLCSVLNFWTLSFKQLQKNPIVTPNTHQHHYFHTHKCSSSLATSVSATTRKKKKESQMIEVYFAIFLQSRNFWIFGMETVEAQCRLRRETTRSGLVMTTEAVSSVHYLIIHR